MKPLELDVNLTPNSSEGPAPVSGVAGVAVFGQIVHGQEEDWPASDARP